MKTQKNNRVFSSNHVVCIICKQKSSLSLKEMVIAKNKGDWFDKIDYYIKNPEKRVPIIEAGRKRVLKEHTYHNRVKQLATLYNAL